MHLRLASKVVACIVCLMMLTLGHLNWTFADGLDINVESWLAAVELYEKDILSVNDLEDFRSDRAISHREFLELHSKIHGYYNSNSSTYLLFEGVIVAKGLVREHEIAYLDEPMHMYNLIEYVFRYEGELPLQGVIYSDLSSVYHWGDAVVFLQQELNQANSSKMENFKYEIREFLEDGTWSYYDFEQYLNYMDFYGKKGVVNNFLISNNSWLIDGIDFSRADDYFPSIEQSLVSDRVLEIMRIMTWGAFTFDDYIESEWKSNGEIVISYYKSANRKRYELPMFWMSIHPPNGNSSIRIDEIIYELHVSQLFDKNEIISINGFTEIEFLNYIKKRRYEDPKYTDLIDTIINVFSKDSDDLVEHLVNNYYDMKEQGKELDWKVLHEQDKKFYMKSDIVNGKYIMSLYLR